MIQTVVHTQCAYNVYLSQNVLSNTPRLSGIRTHNVIGDKHWLHIRSRPWRSPFCQCKYYWLLKVTCLLNTHYMHIVYAQLFVSCLVSWKSGITTRREASSSDTAFPTDETWYKQLCIHFVYIIRLSNNFMIKHKKNHAIFIEFIIWRKVNKGGL